MVTPTGGRTTIEFLLGRGRLEHIDAATAAESAERVVGRAARRLLTAQGGLAAGDLEGAFAAAYDAYRMAAEALLVCQGLRATGGEGSHMTVEDAICGQYSAVIVPYAKATFERFRRTRHAAQYFDPSAAEISDADAEWAIVTAQNAVVGVQQVLAENPPGLYS